MHRAVAVHVPDLPAEQPKFDPIRLARCRRTRMRTELDAGPAAHFLHHVQGELLAVVG
jgi:hypothetical protein